MTKTLYKWFFVLSIISFITGIVLIFCFGKHYAVGFMALGVMWGILSFVQLKALK